MSYLGEVDSVLVTGGLTESAGGMFICANNKDGTNNNKNKFLNNGYLPFKTKTDLQF